MPQSPDVVVREWFEQVWNRRNKSAIAQLMAPDGRVHGMTGPGGPPLVGPEAFSPVFETFHGALGNIHVDVAHTVVEGDTCAALCRVTGHHTGDALGPPTGRAVDFNGMVLLRVDNGRIVEGWNVFDFLGMYQAFGWVSNPVLPRE